VAGGATEHGIVTYVPSRNTHADVSGAEGQHLGPLKTFGHKNNSNIFIKVLDNSNRANYRLNGRRVTPEELSFM
jgi:hypothetical protein